MSYRSYVGAPLTGYTAGSSSYPQTLMMYDIAALQLMYGANYTTNAGNTAYTWNPLTGQMSINGVGQGAPAGNKIFMTIWDGGGVDTYDFSNYATNLTVNLQPGSWTTASTDAARVARQRTLCGGQHRQRASLQQQSGLADRERRRRLRHRHAHRQYRQQQPHRRRGQRRAGWRGGLRHRRVFGNVLQLHGRAERRRKLVRSSICAAAVPTARTNCGTSSCLQFSDFASDARRADAAAASTSRRHQPTKLGAGDRLGHGHGRCDRVGRQIGERNREHAAHRLGVGDLYRCERARHAYALRSRRAARAISEHFRSTRRRSIPATRSAGRSRSPTAPSTT